MASFADTDFEFGEREVVESGGAHATFGMLTTGGPGHEEPMPFHDFPGHDLHDDEYLDSDEFQGDHRGGSDELAHETRMEQDLRLPSEEFTCRPSCISDYIWDAVLKDGKHMPKLPWEKDVLGDLLPRPAFGLPMLGRYDALTIARAAARAEPYSAVPNRIFEKRRLMSARFVCDDDILRCRALRTIRDLVMYCPEDSALGRTLLNVAGQLSPESVIASSFSDTFAGKSTATLLKRSADFDKLARWLVQRRCRPLNFDEKLLYEYLQHLRASDAAPTAADVCLRAVNFIFHAVGMTKDPALLLTPRVKGAARSMYEKKRPLKQARPLSAEHAWMLESFMHSCNDAFLLTICGTLLFSIYSSCRLGDAVRVESFSFSRFGHVHVVEGKTLLHKGGSSQERRTRFLPFMALGTCLDVRPWAMVWASARKSSRVDEAGFVMPGLAKNGQAWLARRMTTGELTQFLREFLVETGVSLEEAEMYTGHSCKATIPTWVGRHGGFSLDERRLLTHHMDKQNEMALTYSRDSLTALHIKVYKVLDKMRLGLWNAIRDDDPAQAPDDLQFEGQDQQSDVEVLPDEAPSRLVLHWRSAPRRSGQCMYIYM